MSSRFRRKTAKRKCVVQGVSPVYCVVPTRGHDLSREPATSAIVTGDHQFKHVPPAYSAASTESVCPREEAKLCSVVKTEVIDLPDETVKSPLADTGGGRLQDEPELFSAVKTEMIDIPDEAQTSIADTEGDRLTDEAQLFSAVKTEVIDPDEPMLHSLGKTEGFPLLDEAPLCCVNQDSQPGMRSVGTDTIDLPEELHTDDYPVVKTVIVNLPETSQVIPDVNSAKQSKHVVKRSRRIKLPNTAGTPKEPVNVRVTGLHVNIHVSGMQCEKPNTRKICNDKVSGLFNPKLHNVIHIVSKSYSCNICQKSFSDQSNLNEHHLTHTGLPYTCNICHKGFTTSNFLTTHALTHTKTEKRTLNNGHDSSQKPDNTKQGKTSAGKSRYTCTICPKSFISQSHLKLHSMTHTGEKPYSCHICQKCFSNKNNLKQHNFIHTGKKPFPCNICPRSFIAPSHLKRHSITHTGEKPYRCPICEKRFSDHNNLRRHRFKHTGEKPYLCSTCGKRFSDSSNLRQHLVSHTGEYRHVCNICQKRFRHPYTLRRHQLNHTGEKPHLCSTCGKRFSDTSNLRQHLLSHTGEYRHVCNICQKRFNYPYNLRRHQLTHSAKQTPKGNV